MSRRKRSLAAGSCLALLAAVAAFWAWRSRCAPAPATASSDPALQAEVLKGCLSNWLLRDVPQLNVNYPLFTFQSSLGAEVDEVLAALASSKGYPASPSVVPSLSPDGFYVDHDTGRRVARVTFDPISWRDACHAEVLVWVEGGTLVGNRHRVRLRKGDQGWLVESNVVVALR